VFRLPGVSLVIPFLLFICVTPLANAGYDWLLALYALPVAGLIYILITRTVADDELIRTTGLLGPHRVAWSDLDGFEFRGPRWATAVAQDGRRFRLPMVRPRDLPRLAQVSGGRLLIGRDAPTPETAGPDDAAPTEPAAAAGDAATTGAGDAATTGAETATTTGHIVPSQDEAVANAGPPKAT
jgi:hypothetical protein